MKKIVCFMALILCVACSKESNISLEYMANTEGRYLFNSDQIIEVSYTDSQLVLKWNGADNIKPMDMGEGAFFVKEMQEKIRFKEHPEEGVWYICFISKETDELEFKFRKMNAGEMVPGEYFEAGEYQKALEGFVAIKEKDSLDPIIEEARMNRWGYNKLREDKSAEAVEVFKINVAMYPNSSNVYDSLGEAYLKAGDTVKALENYKKSLELDSGNRRAQNMINKYRAE
ncbi:hypothetical protein KH5_24480 [Urechidicola sp. KH5]